MKGREREWAVLGVMLAGAAVTAIMIMRVLSAAREVVVTLPADGDGNVGQTLFAQAVLRTVWMVENGLLWYGVGGTAVTAIAVYVTTACWSRWWDGGDGSGTGEAGRPP